MNKAYVRMALKLRSFSPGMLLNPADMSILVALFHGKSVPSGQGKSSMEWCEEVISRMSDNGQILIKSNSLMSALVTAGKYVQWQGRANLTNSSTSLVPGLVTFENDIFPISDPGTETGREEWWMPFKTSNWTRNRQMRESVIVRPRVKRWLMEVKLHFDPMLVSGDKILKLFEIAGDRVGIGDFRVGQFTNGREIDWQSSPPRSRFGRFKVIDYGTENFELSKSA